MIRPPRLTLNCFAELLHRYVDLVQPEWIDLRRNMHRVQHTKRPPRSTRSTLPSSVGKQTKTSFQTETYQIGPHHNQQHRQKARRRHNYRRHPSDRRAPNERCQSEEDEEAHSLSLLCPNSPGGRSTSLRCLHPVRRRFQGRQKNRACG